MDRSQAKSAPPRRKSKFVKNRTNAMKEIQAWIRKDEEFSVPEASRMSGQLSDNVTEERMLKAKLWELSKERYKFLSQNSYEKKVFQDRQQRKANARRVVSASADGRSRNASGEARKGRRSSLGDTQAQHKPRIRNARLALLDRLDPTNKKKGNNKSNIDDSTKDGRRSPVKCYSRTNSRTSGLQHRDSSLSIKAGQAVSSNPPSSNNDQKMTGFERQHNFLANVLTDDSKRPASSPGHGRTSQKAKSYQPIKPAVFSTTTNHANINVTASGPLAQQQTSNAATGSQSSSSWCRPVPGQCSKRYGMRVESKITDPRYASLEQRLSPLIRSNTTTDVSSIVNTIESLHIRPKRRPADSNRSRTKIEVKALEFIKEKGFLF